MDREEIRFRLTCAARNRAQRARSAISPAAWRRGDLVHLLDRSACERDPELNAARTHLEGHNWASAHRALAAHFIQRRSTFPLQPGELPELRRRVNARFPDAAPAAAARANDMLDGRYDVLGYEHVEFGTPPRWHRDPVHGRETPRGFWSSIPYLDPQYGDHKIIWEINRHQHWLGLGRAYHLTDDPRYYAAFVDQLNDWMAENPPLQGVNWASMLELGLRSISWLWALHFFAPAVATAAQDTSSWTVDLLLGIDRQLTHVERNLSRYFSPNTHLTGEALALYVGGMALPELRASRRRVRIGREILLTELERQVRGDGGHAELSAHYHRYTTDFYLLAAIVARAGEDPAAAVLTTAARRLAEFLRTLADDRGRIPLLGDDDGGQLFPVCGRAPWDCRDTLAAAASVLKDPSLAVSETPEEVFWLCGDLPLEAAPFAPSHRRSVALPDTGYYVSRTAQGDHLIFDAGRHGYLNGGHAHADALSILLTVSNKPLLVDAGTGTYTTEPQLRDQFRSTAMHNTVVVNGASQSRMRGPFHWSSAAVARASLWQSNPGFDYAEGYHDGYGAIVHTRGVLSLHGTGWLILDHLLGTGEARADTFWHLHPDWSAKQAGTSIQLRQVGNVAAAIAGSDTVHLVSGCSGKDPGLYAPVYGRIEHGVCLQASATALLPRSALTVVVSLNGHAHRTADLVVKSLPLTALPGEGWHAAAFAVTTPTHHLVVLSAVPRNPGGSADEPACTWGCAAATTDGRLAVVDIANGATVVLIGGTRAVLSDQLAPSVHSPARTCA
jgi:hypothetical protein